MPITFSITCDTDEELARLIENLRFNRQIKPLAEGSDDYASEDSDLPAKRESVIRRRNKRIASSGYQSRTGSYSERKPGRAKPGRKPGKLVPVIEECILEVVKRGKPFRSREVVDLVTKVAPDLNENSVVTGVSKILGESDLDFDQIKDAVGRPYKLYKP